MIEREFEYTSQKDNSSGIITLKIDLPEPTGEDDWECRYVLEFPDRTAENKIIGIDGLQALLLAIKTAKKLLISYAANNELTISWLGMENLGLEMIV